MQPTDLSAYPDRIKLMWFQWVVDLGLERKDKELARGWDKGVIRCRFIFSHLFGQE